VIIPTHRNLDCCFTRPSGVTKYRVSVKGATVCNRAWERFVLESPARIEVWAEQHALCMRKANKAQEKCYSTAIVLLVTSLPMPTQNIFFSTHHIKSFDACIEY
jgi:hypothetical protein